MHELTEKFKPYAPVFLRFGLALVFLVFGFQKLSFPSQGTAEIQLIFTSAGGKSFLTLGMASAMNYYMGLFELMLGISLTLGWMIRWAALFAALMVVGIFASILFKYGFNSSDKTLLLDAALVGAAAGLWALGAGKWSIDGRPRVTDDGQPVAAQPHLFAVYAPVVIRAGLAISLLLLGYQQVKEGALAFGCAELVLAVFLIGGFLVEYAAPFIVLLTVWGLFGSIAAHGIFIQGVLPDPALSRDLGVIGAALALWALGAGRFSIDGKKKEEPMAPPATPSQ